MTKNAEPPQQPEAPHRQPKRLGESLERQRHDLKQNARRQERP